MTFLKTKKEAKHILQYMYQVSGKKNGKNGHENPTGIQVKYTNLLEHKYS